MTMACAGPNPDLGVALRMADYVDCQARAIGENGYQALVGGPIVAGLLSGLVTVFVALIGYRLILGSIPTVRDGVTWAVRLGVVLALTTGWPAYRTLIYRVAVDAPIQLAATILPAAGLSGENLNGRVQQAYDTLRLGTVTDTISSEATQPLGVPGQPSAAPTPSAQAQATQVGQAPLPQTASVLVLSTAGISAALRVATGFLLAVGPLAVMSLLFDATLGLFSGWMRALGGIALGTLAATLVTAIDLVMVESELARLQAYSASGVVTSIDPQAVTTIVLAFALVMLVAVFAAVRMAGAFRLPGFGIPMKAHGLAGARSDISSPALQVRSLESRQGSASEFAPAARVSTVVDALSASVRREQNMVLANGPPSGPSRTAVLPSPDRRMESHGIMPLGASGRRINQRRSFSAARRDRSA